MKLYVYDHCPYCVKARMIFGYKSIPFELISLLNDDEKTPIEMIGQKMVPILERAPGDFFPESLDIVDWVNQQDQKPFVDLSIEVDQKLSQWLQEARDYIYPLAMPRWIQVGLKEFSTSEAINYFVKKKEDYIGDFKGHIEKTEEYIQKAQEHLKDLEELLKPNQNFYAEKASLNDIHLYPALRSLSVVKGLAFPPKVQSYMAAQEELTKVPLHLNLAV